MADLYLKSSLRSRIPPKEAVMRGQEAKGR